MHLLQQEPAVAGQPQLHGQQSLPQQQVDFAGVAEVMVMVISVKVREPTKRVAHGGEPLEPSIDVCDLRRGHGAHVAS